MTMGRQGGSALQGRVALVTGGGSGMGRATSVAMAAAGAAVLVVDIDEDGGAHTVDEITGLGSAASFLRADVACGGDVASAVQAAIERYGRLDCAVNNAALRPDTRRIVDADDDQFERILAVNLTSVFLCMKHEIRAMIAQSCPGSVVNIGSVRSFRAMAGSPAYVAAKHGVIGLTRVAALEYASHGIRVNAICPGAINTPMVKAAQAARGEDEVDMARRLTLLGRLGTVEEIADATVWLSSDSSAFMTGQSIVIDGGYLIQ